MRIHCDKVTDVKSDQRGTSSKMWAGQDYWFVNEDATPLIGKDLEIEVTEKTSAKGNKYKIGKVVKVIEGAAAASSNGHIAWADYEHMAQLAHQLAMNLEPDGSQVGESAEGENIVLPTITVDRSSARAAILNTVMIAFSNGKISLPAEDDQDIPF